MPSMLLVELLTVFIAVCVYMRLMREKQKPLPPGPRRWPIFGNVMSMPKEKEWRVFAEWQKKYGDIISMSLFGRSVIILNSSQAAIDLLHKRSSIYSDKPDLAMGELIGWGNSLPLTHYGEKFRQMRRLTHQVLSPRPAQAFWPVEEREATLFLNRLLESPEQLFDHIRHTAGSIILKISHGYTVSPSGKDHLVSVAETATEEFSLATAPGAFWVDFLPWLKYVPMWFPGANFRRIASEWRRDAFRMADDAHEFTKNEMAKGQALPSFTSDLLDKGHTQEYESLVKWTAFSIYGGGADTTVSAISSFFLAMCINPQVQIVAQAELDAVLGNERLPTVRDRASLPYINAIVKEVLRWGPVVPSSFHRLTQDDEYEGYRIPAGSVIISNIWWMLNNPDTFSEPHKFCPERFISTTSSQPEPDPLQIVFGFGRRKCPGQYLAEPSLFLSIAMTLATFTISKVQDEVSGEILEPVVDWLPGSITHPNPFRCDIKPRSSRAIELIGQAVGELELKA